MEVVHLKEVKSEANPALVSTLEKMLIEARAGNIQSVVVISLVKNQWVHFSHGLSKVNEILSMAGMLSAVKTRVELMIQWKNL